MPAINPEDFSNAKLDVDHMAALATSASPTAVDRFGQEKKTWTGIKQELDSEYTLTAAAQSRAAAESAAGAAAVRAEDAQTAKVQTEAIRDQATAASRARASITAALADATIAVGSSFTAPLADGSLQTYSKTSTTVATAIGLPFAKDADVKKPVWAGRKNGWPDQFFRRSKVGADFMGRARWATTGGSPGLAFSLVKNSVFDGKALRRSVVGVVQLGGPVIYLDEIGAAPGDTVTVRGLIAGAGATAIFQMRAFTAADVGVGTAVNAKTDAGADAVAGSTPQRVTASFVVAANASKIIVYPYIPSGGGTFDIVALWAFKGAPADGPDWPTFDEPSPAEEYSSTTNTARISAVEAPVSYGFESFGVVSASATAVAIAGAGFSSNPRDLAFRGWGEAYSPAGVSFNAIRCRVLGRTAALASSRWRTLRAVVRTGATPAAAGATVVAVGSITVREGLDTLTDVQILLKDPATGDVKTLTDADFTGGAYFVAVYAENAAGAPAACGEPRGTMPNSLGQSYYVTAADPLTGAYAATAGASNVRLAFEHLLLTAPVEETGNLPSTALVKAIGDAAVVAPPELVLPPYVFGVQGRECNVYLENLHLDSAKAWLHNVDSPGNVGQQQNERWTWKPTAALAAGVLSVAVHDPRTGFLLVTKTAQLRAAAASAGAGTTQRVLVIGDSLPAAGVITQGLLDIASGDAMGITLLGTQGTGLNKHEGRGGWTIANYTSAGPTYYDFTVSGVSVPPAINSTDYAHNGSVYRVQSVSALVDGAGTIRCAVVSGGAPLSAGALTKNNGGAGDATIVFSASTAVPGNPFFIGGVINFGQYLTNNGFAAPHAVFVGLGTNDCFSQTTDAGVLTVADGAFTALDTLIASIKAADTNTKVVLALPPPPSFDQDAFGQSYATGQTRWRFNRNILLWAKRLMEKYAGQEAARIYIAPSNVAWDTVHNAQLGPFVPANSRQPQVVHKILLATAPAISPMVGARYETTGAGVGHTFTVTGYNAAEPLALYCSLTSDSAQLAMLDSGSLKRVFGTGSDSVPFLGYTALNGIRRMVNGVHPPATGYLQVSDVWWAILKYLA